MREVRSRISYLLAFAGAALLIWYANMARLGVEVNDLELDFDIPVAQQIALAGGDRFLAANVAVWRAVVVRTHRLDPSMIRLLAKLQVGASWMNPAHEDNYYTATAILPWSGHLEESQLILQRASEFRQQDIWPPFFLGFNRMYFLADFKGAAEAALQAAKRSVRDSEQNALAMMATRWLERQGDIPMAMALLGKMADGAIDPALKDHLQTRIAVIREYGIARELFAAYKEDTDNAQLSMSEFSTWAKRAHSMSFRYLENYSIKNGELTIGKPPGSK